MPPKTTHYKLLLEKMLPRREKFPSLNNCHNSRHLVHDFRLSGVEEQQRIKLAKREERIIVTRNISHFRDLGRKQEVDIIGVTETIYSEELDISFMVLLRRREQQNMSGSFDKLIRKVRKM